MKEEPRVVLQGRDAHWMWFPCAVFTSACVEDRERIISLVLSHEESSMVSSVRLCIGRTAKLNQLDSFPAVSVSRIKALKTNKRMNKWIHFIARMALCLLCSLG